MGPGRLRDALLLRKDTEAEGPGQPVRETRRYSNSRRQRTSPPILPTVVEPELCALS